MARGPNNIDWTKAAFLTVPVYVPTCPHCGSDEFKRLRGRKENDGSSMQHAVCLGCNEPIIIVREFLPCDGNQD